MGVRSGGDFVFRMFSIVRRVPKQYKCSLCTDIFKTVKDRNEHVREIHNIQSFKCPDCDNFFKTESSMKQHGFEHKEGGKTYPCSVCEKFFYFLSHLKRHEATHSEEPLFKCVYSECHKLKGWRDMSDYNRHMLRYHKREDKNLILRNNLHLCVAWFEFSLLYFLDLVQFACITRFDVLGSCSAGFKSLEFVS